MYNLSHFTACTMGPNSLSLHDALPIWGIAIAIALAAIACTGEPLTEIVVISDTDLAVPETIDTIRIEIHGDGRVERATARSEEHTSELQSLAYLVCRLLLEKKKSGYSE